MSIVYQDNGSLFYTNPMLFRIDHYGEIACKTLQISNALAPLDTK